MAFEHAGAVRSHRLRMMIALGEPLRRFRIDQRDQHLVGDERPGLGRFEGVQPGILGILVVIDVLEEKAHGVGHGDRLVIDIDHDRVPGIAQRDIQLDDRGCVRRVRLLPRNEGGGRIFAVIIRRIAQIGRRNDRGLIRLGTDVHPPGVRAVDRQTGNGIQIIDRDADQFFLRHIVRSRNGCSGLHGRLASGIRRTVGHRHAQRIGKTLIARHRQRTADICAAGHIQQRLHQRIRQRQLARRPVIDIHPLTGLGIGQDLPLVRHRQQRRCVLRTHRQAFALRQRDRPDALAVQHDLCPHVVGEHADLQHAGQQRQTKKQRKTAQKTRPSLLRLQMSGDILGVLHRCFGLLHRSHLLSE